MLNIHNLFFNNSSSSAGSGCCCRSRCYFFLSHNNWSDSFNHLSWDCLYDLIFSFNFRLINLNDCCLHYFITDSLHLRCFHYLERSGWTTCTWCSGSCGGFSCRSSILNDFWPVHLNSSGGDFSLRDAGRHIDWFVELWGNSCNGSCHSWDNSFIWSGRVLAWSLISCESVIGSICNSLLHLTLNDCVINHRHPTDLFFLASISILLVYLLTHLANNISNISLHYLCHNWPCTSLGSRRISDFRSDIGCCHSDRIVSLLLVQRGDYGLSFSLVDCVSAIEACSDNSNGFLSENSVIAEDLDLRLHDEHFFVGVIRSWTGNFSNHSACGSRSGAFVSLYLWLNNIYGLSLNHSFSQIAPL